MSFLRSRTTYVLTLLQLPLIEVGNAMRAYCYSTASYPLDILVSVFRYFRFGTSSKSVLVSRFDAV